MQERPESTNSAPVALVKSAGGSPALRAPVAEPDIFFTRAEFDAILSLYGRKVVEGEWRDYAIGSTREVATFAIHRRASEQPLFRIEKRPKLARRQGAFSVVAASGLVMKRGHDLAQVLKIFEKRVLRIIDA
ncbi:MAG: DUF2794 domain-containing protein [Parvibaculum sp.]|nr:DUF2794 domain-containing protein [Parvibaculum sp.]|tara:strand:- start:1322 stop:1717 length:396 start_codon:yes stop_codon:yes gene_type:complete